jgi:hypothetical protein
MNAWRDDYIAALAEKDPDRQRTLVYQAIVAIEQRRMNPLSSEEADAIEKADKALKILRGSLLEGGHKR